MHVCVCACAGVEPSWFSDVLTQRCVRDGINEPSSPGSCLKVGNLGVTYLVHFAPDWG